MNFLQQSWKFVQAPSFCQCIRYFSSSSRFAEKHKGNVYEYRRRWVNNEKWRINRFTGKPWAPNVPMEQNIDFWRKDNAYFGAYDFMDILGDDLTLDPNLLCQGPSYLRGQHLTELERLVKRRKMHGTRMHAESLDQMEKRIAYLLKRENRFRNKRTRHPKINEWEVPLIKERFE